VQETFFIQMAKKQITSELQAIFDGLDHEVTVATLKWRTAKGLFAVSQKQCELLDRTANAFFQVCQVTFRDETFLSLSRLTDPLRTSGHDNLCLDRLSTHLEKSAHPQFASKLEELISNAKDACNPVRLYRMRKLAHADLATVLSFHPEPLPEITLGQVDRALAGVQNVLNSFSEYIFDSSILYEHLMQTGGPDVLVRYLERGERGFEEDFKRKLDTN
jgi:hypothetical protein